MTTRARVARWASRTLLGGVAGATIVAAAVLPLPTGSPLAPLGPRPASADTLLAPFTGCAELAGWYRKQALPQVTAWGLPYDGPIYAISDAAVPVRAADAAASPADLPVGNGPTGTNVQELGVDESDIAKTMGDLVISAPSHRLLVTDVSGAAPVEVGHLELSPRFSSYELLVVGDRAVVIGSQTGYGWGGPGGFRTDGPIAFSSSERSSITTVDLSDPTAPSILARNVVEGDIVTSREHDATVRVVLTSAPRLDLVHPSKLLSRREALRSNRQIVRTATAQDWLPERGLGPRGAYGRPLLGCGGVSHPRTAAGLGTITVLTMNPLVRTGITTTAVAADGSLVYASVDRLYVATVDGGIGAGLGDRESRTSWRNPATEIHAFETAGTQTTYVASGEVVGVAPDRWAFSDYRGSLRVVTTRRPWRRSSDNAVTVLSERGNRLLKTGEVGGLGRGEQIHAVRWFGDRAVVVTFRQIDPLYALDLSDPENPRVTDTLKVPGFSDYLHPVGGDVLLGVGEGPAEGDRPSGAQVSTFDLAKLGRIDQVTFAGSFYSPVQNDARAFTYLPELRIALVPTYGDREGVGFNVVHVGDAGSLLLRETVAIAGWHDSLRSLPLDRGRVALVVDGRVRQVLALG